MFFLRLNIKLISRCYFFAIANSSSCQLWLVLVWNANLLHLRKLVLLDSFKFENFISLSHSDLSALLKEIESSLLFMVWVILDLQREVIFVTEIGTFLLFSDSSLPILDTFLLIDNFKELRSFKISLICKLRFSLKELYFSSLLKISQKSDFLFRIKFFNISSLSFLCFISSLGSDSINFSLSISSFLL